ncbi:MAG: GTP-binding protein [Deltaproteobacteria bacterium]|nr:GTP-binding protein [Deltaproteobacteria bacterium]MBW2657977.1 GTP-binding protein [Deltaproteobacteria bacterium]
MDGSTAVLLITGFLGSGKTTFLNRLVHHFPKDRRLTILMNEFGEIGVDGTLVEGDDIDIMEISRGSIFCVCVKTDFIKGLYELNTIIQPDLLIIESTGVANPSDLKRDLKLPIFNDRFDFKDQFCIIDAAHFLDAFEIFASVEKQLETSTVFIINKTDLVAEEVVEKIKQLVRNYHPNPRFFETTFSDIPLELFPFYAENSGAVGTGEQHLPVSSTLTSKELDLFLTDLLAQPDLQTAPPDQLASVTYKWNGENLAEIKDMVERLPDSIIRAKGFVRADGAVSLFSFVLGDWTLDPWERNPADIKHMNVVIFIGEVDGMEQIATAVAGGNWARGEVIQPILQTTII